MEFRIANDGDTKSVKRLWDYCFETEDTPFFKYYFEKAYEPEHTLVGYENETLASMVHLRQYNLDVRGAILPVSYMVGVATDPIARRGGIGGRLLKHSLEELRSRKQGLTILMPSKSAFYQQYGWDLYAHQWVQTLPLDELRPLTDKTMEFGLLEDVSEWTLLAPVYEAYTKNTSGHAVRGEAEWTRLLESLFAEGVRVAYVRGPAPMGEATQVGSHSKKGQWGGTREASQQAGATTGVGQWAPIEGYAMYRLGESEIPVTEFIYTTRRAQRGLLNYFYNHRSQGHTLRWNEGLKDESYIFHPDGKAGHTTMPFMMSRIVDVPLAVSQVPVNEGAAKDLLESGHSSWQMRVIDSLAEWNDQVFSFQLVKASEDAAMDMTHGEGAIRLTAEAIVDSDAVGKPILTITVGALSLLLMGRMTASELLFEGKLEGSLEGASLVKALDALYPKVHTFINEWW